MEQLLSLLYSNKIAKLPIIAYLPALQFLYPHHFFSYTVSIHRDLGYNQISSVPQSITTITNLLTLWFISLFLLSFFSYRTLNSNLLTSLSEFGAGIQLTQLYIHWINFTTFLKKKQNFLSNVGNNYLKSLPDSFSTLKYLTSAFVNNCPFYSQYFYYLDYSTTTTSQPSQNFIPPALWRLCWNYFYLFSLFS